MEFQKSSHPVSSWTLPVTSQIEHELVPRCGSPGHFRLKISSTIMHPLVCRDAIRNKSTSSSLVLEGGSWLFFGTGLELHLLHGDWPGECARSQDGKDHHEKELTCWFSWLCSVQEVAPGLWTTPPAPTTPPLQRRTCWWRTHLGKGWRKLFPGVSLGRWRHRRIGSLTDDTPQPGAGRALPHPQQSSRTCFENLNMHIGGDCEFTFQQDPRWRWCCWLGPTLGTTRR